MTQITRTGAGAARRGTRTLLLLPAAPAPVDVICGYVLEIVVGICFVVPVVGL